LRAYAGNSLSASEYLGLGLGMGTGNLLNLGVTGGDQVQDLSLRFRDINTNHSDYTNPMDVMNNLLNDGGMNGSVINSGQIDIFTNSSGTSFGVNLGALGQSWGLAENSGRLMVVSNDDGSKEVEQFVSFMDGASILNSSSIDPNGLVTELGGQIITSLEENSAIAVNLARATGQPVVNIVQPGGTLSIQVTPELMEELSTRYAEAYDLHPDIINSVRTVGSPVGAELNLGTQNEFLNNIGRSNSGTADLANLTSEIMNVDDQMTGTTNPFDHLGYEITDPETGASLADSEPDNSPGDINAQLDELQAKLENIETDIEDFGDDMEHLENEVDEMEDQLDVIEEGIDNLNSGSDNQDSDSDNTNSDSGSNLTGGLVS